MRLLWLPDVLRAAGLTVHEVDGWRERGAGTFGPVRGITIHETRGSRTSTDAGEIRVLIEGSTSAPPPIAPLYLSRSGAWHVVASGTCNHNRVGYAGPNEGFGNDALLGIEAQHAAGEPWTDVQYQSYVRGVAALVDRLDVPVSRVAGHKEHQPGQKTDPGFDMTRFRADVARMLAGGLEDEMPLSSTDISAVATRVWSANWGPETATTRLLQARDEARRARMVAEATLTAVQGAGVDRVLARIEQLAQEERARDEAAARERAALPGQILAALPGGDGPVSRDDLEAALRTVLGSVDELPAAAPQG